MGQDWKVRFSVVFRHRGSDLLLVARENWFKFLISRGQRIQQSVTAMSLVEFYICVLALR